MRIAVIDYGIGNLRSAEKALQHLGADATLTADADAIAAADAVVLPGVGAFGACMRALRASRSRGGGEGSGNRRAAVPRRLRRDADAVRGQRRVARRARSRCRRGARHAASRHGTPPADRLEHPRVAAREPARRRARRRRRGCTSCTRSPPSPTDDGVVAAWCDVRPALRGRDRAGPLWATQFHPEKSGDVGAARCWRTSSRPPRSRMNMDLYPAIDLRGGRVVQLQQGDYGRGDAIRRRSRRGRARLRSGGRPLDPRRRSRRRARRWRRRIWAAIEAICRERARARSDRRRCARDRGREPKRSSSRRRARRRRHRRGRAS